MRMILPFLMAIGLLFTASHAQAKRKFVAQMLSWEEYGRLNKGQRKAYLKDLRFILSVLEKKQKKYEMADAGQFERMKESVAQFLKMAELMPSAYAEMTPEERRQKARMDAVNASTARQEEEAKAQREASLQRARDLGAETRSRVQQAQADKAARDFAEAQEKERQELALQKARDAGAKQKAKIQEAKAARDERQQIADAARDRITQKDMRRAAEAQFSTALGEQQRQQQAASLQNARNKGAEKRAEIQSAQKANSDAQVAEAECAPPRSMKNGRCSCGGDLVFRDGACVSASHLANLEKEKEAKAIREAKATRRAADEKLKQEARAEAGLTNTFNANLDDFGNQKPGPLFNPDHTAKVYVAEGWRNPEYYNADGSPKFGQTAVADASAAPGDTAATEPQVTNTNADGAVPAAPAPASEAPPVVMKPEELPKRPSARFCEIPNFPQICKDSKDSGGAITDAIKEEYRKSSKTNSCIVGGRFSTYKSPKPEAGQCDFAIYKNANGKKVAEENPCANRGEELCSPVIFCAAVEVDDSFNAKMRSAMRSVGLKTSDKNTLKPHFTMMVGDEMKNILQVPVCAPKGEDFTQRCKNRHDTVTGGNIAKGSIEAKAMRRKSDFPVGNSKKRAMVDYSDSKVLSCDPANIVHSPAKEDVAQEWLKTKKSIEDEFEAMCLGDSKFQKMFCYECGVISDKVVAWAQLVRKDDVCGNVAAANPGGGSANESKVTQ